jgi:Hint domain
VSVESLQVGDVFVTASGEQRPVKWIGHSDFDLRSHPNPRPVFPVRIAADALGLGRPS